MPWTKEQKYEAIGGAAGVVLAYLCIGIGALLGVVRVGIALLVLTVPAGLVLGYAVIYLLRFRDRMLDD